MITITMVKQPVDYYQHVWSINPLVFPIIHEANENWPGVIAYRLTGQEKYYEPTWVPEGSNPTIPKSHIIESINKSMLCERKLAEDAVPSTERVEEDTMCSNIQRKPLTFIDLKVQQ